MSDDAKLVGEVARQVLGRLGEDPWRTIVEQEWVGVAVDPDHGGQGGTLEEAAALAHAAGATAAAAPVLEAVLAAIAAAASPGACELVPRLAGGEQRAVLVPRPVAHTGLAGVAVPWAREADVVLAVVEDGGAWQLASVPRDRLDVQPGATVAGDPSDLVTLRGGSLRDHLLEGEIDRDALLAATGVLTAARLLGAIEAVHAMTVEYAEQRKQFGVPLASFQALAHGIARQAGATELARAGLRAALPAALAGDAALPAAARVVAGDGSRDVASIAHQVHGAIGVTREHDLHRFTLRMRAWRDAYGTARRWESLLGRVVVERPSALWDASIPEGVA
jgi:acyl-CoA dehydrogenase